MNIVKATDRYDKWIQGFMPIVAADLAFKHEQMAAAPFPFLRATYYRWAQVWPKTCDDQTSAPMVLSVGDLHVENFGTWRDSEGRLVWGVNDFDEASLLPYTNDLIRLGTSFVLSAQERSTTLEPDQGLEALLDGYRKGLEAGGRPFVLADHHVELRKMATGELRDPVKFWAKAARWPQSPTPPCDELQEAVMGSLPPDASEIEVKTRRAGLGSLGRPRFLFVAEVEGGRVAREAKALAPSAAIWAAGELDGPVLYQDALDRSVRCSDPFTKVSGRWLIRRLAPDCSRIELADLAKERDESRLLASMGYETANMHLGTREMADKILEHVKKKPKRWLRQACKDMVDSTVEDHLKWRDRGKG